MNEKPIPQSIDHEKIENPSQRIRRYLKEGKSLQFAKIEGISFLRYCIAIIDEELAIEIIKHGVDLDINEPWDNGQTPLHFACKLDLIQLIQSILTLKSHEVDLYAVTDDLLLQCNEFQCGGKTVLHYAAMNGGGVFLSVCKLLIEFERTILHRNELSMIKDLEGNDAITDALMYRHENVVRYLLSIQKMKKKDSNHSNHLIHGFHAMESEDEWIQRRMDEVSTKKGDDSKATRTRYEQIESEIKGMESMESINTDLKKEGVDKLDIDIINPMNEVFVIPKLWNQQQCASMLEAVTRFGDEKGWSLQRHRSYATTDIPTHVVGEELDENLRKTLSEELFPRIIEKYKLMEKMGVNVDEGERVEIGVRDLFFVKYDMVRQRELKLHRDGVLVSFNILLNDASEFEGGGTYFQHLDKVIGIERGDCVFHSGNVLHAGHPITSGERYILVGFLDGKVRRQIAKLPINERENGFFHEVNSF